MYSLSLVGCAKFFITYCKEYRQIPLTQKSVSPNTGFFLCNNVVKYQSKSAIAFLDNATISPS